MASGSSFLMRNVFRYLMLLIIMQTWIACQLLSFSSDICKVRYHAFHPKLKFLTDQIGIFAMHAMK